MGQEGVGINMSKTYYRVGRHSYCVDWCDGDDGGNLLQSSEPFRMDTAPDDDEPLLFVLRIVGDDVKSDGCEGREIGQFDCGGNNHGVYRLDDGGYRVVVDDVDGRTCCVLRACADFSSAEVRLNGTTEMRRMGLNNALMMMYAFAGSDKMTVLMHASVVRKDGRGYLCLGTSGTGKSTHTANWLRFVPNCDLLNDDNPVVRVCDDGVARVFGSPWSGKTACYRNEEALIGGFLQLKQAPRNRIERMRTVEAYGALLSSCSVMKWDRRDYVGTSDTVARLLENVPVFLLENLPDEAAVRMSYEAMAEGKV